MESDDDPDDDQPEHDLLVVLKLSNRAIGRAAEREQIELFADELATAVAEAGVGEFDGDELGGGECILFFCGPDLERLLGVLLPLLRRSPLCRGASIVRMEPDEEGHWRQVRRPL
jgi:hypothetical protein